MILLHQISDIEYRFYILITILMGYHRLTLDARLIYDFNKETSRWYAQSNILLVLDIFRINKSSIISFKYKWSVKRALDST